MSKPVLARPESAGTARANATRLPSGDQLGWMSVGPLPVSDRSLRPERLKIELAPPAPSRSNASLPRREKAGSRSAEGLRVTSRRPLPVGPVR
jgi:hypothetical protein